MPHESRAQWALHVIVWHGPAFGHKLTIETQTQGREPVVRDGGTWRGIGIPEPVLQSFRTYLDAIVTEHLTTRYGIQGELFDRRESEPEPF